MGQVKICLFLITLLVGHFSLAQMAASRAADFNNAQGINVQLRNIWNPYGNLPLVSNSLNYLGIKHIRDESPQDADLVNRFKTLASQGFKWDLIIGSNPNQQMNQTWLQNELSMIKQVISAYPGSVVGLEGLNEPYNFPNYWNGVLTNNWSIVNQVQQAEFAAVNNDPVLANIPLLTPSLYPTAFPNTPINNGPYADIGNAHTYPEWAAQPGATLAKDFSDQQRILAIGKPAWITEFGYSVTPSDHQWGVNETAQAKYIVNGLADAYKLGVGRIYIYHLIEYGDVSNPKPWGANAIFFADGRPKKAATAVHNLNTVLADSGTNKSSFAPGSLALSLSGMPSTAKSLLLQKSNGNFYLLLWNEVKSYDQATERDIYVAPVPVTVSLGSPAASVRVFNTMVGTTATQSFSNTSSFSVGVPDNIIILEIEGAAQGPQPYTLSISSPSEGATVSGNFQLTGSAPGFLNVEVFSSAGALLGRGTPSATGAFSIAVDSTKLLNGVQDLTVRAWDAAAGQPATQTATINRSVNVQNVSATTTTTTTTTTTVPTQSHSLAISSPAAGATVSGIIQISGSYQGYLNIEVFNSEGTMLSRATLSGGTYSASVDTKALANGSQTLTIRAWDSLAGQAFTRTEAKLISLNVQNSVAPSPTDSLAPSVSITSPANEARINRGSLISVSASASDAVGVIDVKFYLNGSLVCIDAAADYQCQMRLPKKRGYVTIEAQARDAAGNVGRHSIRVYSQ